jgi:hydrogenase maturation protease
VADSNKVRTLVLGVGNTLMSDEGIGVRVVECLVNNFSIPEEVQVLDGGTLGMDLLYYMEGVPNLLIVDAVQANREPGHLLRLENDEVPAFLSMKVSPHQIGVPDMLATARLRGTTPPNIVLWGVQPDRVEIGMELSGTLEPLVDVLVENVVQELRRWGHDITPVPR